MGKASLGERECITMKPVFPWPGGKSWAAKYVLPMIPPHECYCEPFAGGLATLPAKEPSTLEVVNDAKAKISCSDFRSITHAEIRMMG
jgi:site-specific DNA-adenine methylase